MTSLSSDDLRQLQQQLQQAVVACNERCLYHSAKWLAENDVVQDHKILMLNRAAELLNSLPEPQNDDVDGDTEVDTPEEDTNDEHDPISNLAVSATEARLQRKELPKFLMAKSIFDCREYDRCAATLVPSLLPQQPINRDLAQPYMNGATGKGKTKAAASPPNVRTTASQTPKLSQKSLFLALYAKYIAGEKRKEEDSEMILGPADGPITMNKELITISTTLDRYLSERSSEAEAQSDGFLEYLYAIVLLKTKNEALAKTWLLRSVSLYEWNWGAWQELTSLIDSIEELSEICQHIKPSMPAFLFQIHCSQELYQANDQIHDKITQISNVFPNSAFLQTQRALLHYHAKDFEEAARIFSSMMADHPHRLDSLDSYSNILYVMEGQRPRLSYLASIASATDKFRPETCCIIGNHYSKSSEHEKAVMYFRRALTLDRSFLSAWTLMGHEYLELKNTQAAIESYRRAVDANKKDYRAWHGLGLGYEILDMNSYALYYFQRAAALQPWDPKMWAAVGEAFKRCGKLSNAVKAFKRALAAQSHAENGDLGLGVSFAASTASSAAALDPLMGAVGGRLNADVLFEIACLYEQMEDMQEAASYMELCLAQEDGPDEEDIPPGVMPSAVPTGIGVTQTTSRARLWLSKWCFARQEWQRATELANELCQDGFEVEEAKALIRDVRARLGGDAVGLEGTHLA